MLVEMCGVDKVIPYARNPRKNNNAIPVVKASIKEFGFQQPIVVDKEYVIVVGHTRYEAAKQLGYTEVPVTVADKLTPQQIKAYRIADNKSAEYSEFDNELLILELQELQDANYDVYNTALSQEEIKSLITLEDAGVEAEKKKLSDLFIAPPFSVLDARQGYFLNRTREWKALGIHSEVGRGDELTFSKGLQQTPLTNEKKHIEGRLGVKLEWEDYLENYCTMKNLVTPATSVFNPTLTEIAYTWFCKDGGNVLDPFAGGSVRGIVAGKLGYNYVGVDLSKEQIEANIIQGNKILTKEDGVVKWYIGDSNNIDTIVEDYKADMIFTCPPYADLEVYSDDPADISNMSYDDFLNVYSSIINKCYNMLEDNSFACIVVGEVRDKKTGNYYNFVGDTIKAFVDAGFNYYNEIIFISSATASLRAARYMKASRKVAKVHQNVLTFLKGNVEKCKVLKKHYNMLTFLKGDIDEVMEKLGDVEIVDIFNT